METIKAITLYQPWASLVVAGHKHIETRSWGTRYRGTLVIHASKAFPGWVADLCRSYSMQAYLRYAGIVNPEQLPRGAILGMADLVSDVTFDRDNLWRRWQWKSPNGRWFDFHVTPREVAFGDFSPGRHGFLLSDAIAFAAPIVGVRGALGLWNIERSRLPPEALDGYWEGRASA